MIQVQQFLTDVSATRGLDGLDDGFEKAQEHRAAFQAVMAVFQKSQDAGEFAFEAGKLDLLNRQFDT